MDTRGFLTSLFRRPGIFLISTLAIALTALASGAATGVSAAETGIQFDEVTRIITQDDHPQPGSFAGDFQAAVAAGQQQAAAANQHQGHGLFAMIKSASQAIKNAGAFLKSGAASTEYYLGNLRRLDNPGAQTATIYRPEQHQIINLDLAKKTYNIIDTDMTASGQMPPQGPPGRGNPGPQQTMPPGGGRLDVTVANTVLGPKTIENVETTGYSSSFKSALTKSTGSCKDVTFEAKLTEYLSNYPEPGISHIGAPRPSFAVRPETAGVPLGCTPTMMMHKSGGGSAPTGRLAMWTLVGLGGSAKTTSGPLAAGFQSLTERGNVHVLGAGDKKLFDIPAGFTKELSSPAPGAP